MPLRHALNGNLASVTAARINGVDQPDPASVHSYDAAGHLTTLAEGPTTFYAYDLAGNLQCHGALENQPARGASKPANNFRGDSNGSGINLPLRRGWLWVCRSVAGSPASPSVSLPPGACR
ncbi:MAG: RHS repeat domain-containing protein [Tepidisphaerales bacterium]